ncbi:hypothetical protein NDU88_003051 [Pleurodeles waltl]|uniref:Uncharacterized protein n=1 Tax=Pleurodeles waltl TaxID=8319 RepID=A0AAV7UBM5_PLEWA|nr:hypothetical protein NDU88_003051 [Pleurodeles waltl]
MTSSRTVQPVRIKFQVPVKTKATLGHRPEERDGPGEDIVTSRKTNSTLRMGDGVVDDGKVTSTSAGGGYKELLSLEEEWLDYEGDLSLEKGEFLEETDVRQGVCTNKSVRGSDSNRGCVAGPASGVPTVWTVEHSFVCWAAKQVEKRCLGKQLGLDEAQIMV